MAIRIILLSGAVSSGKTTLVGSLAKRFGFRIFKTRDLLQRRLAKRILPNRFALQREGDRLDQTTRGRWVAHELSRELRRDSSINAVVVDAVRTADQIDSIRRAFGQHVVHIHLTAPLKILRKRFQTQRVTRSDEPISYEEVRGNPTEQQVEQLGDIADIVIDTHRCTPQDVLTRAAARLGQYGSLTEKLVDVVIGGQYGSEGKGQIADYLADEYQLLVRVGGPNAGHTVYEEPKPYTHHLLPSGTRRTDAQLLIGPGAVINVEYLLREIADCRVDSHRLSIDPQVMVITDEDIKSEEELRQRIGSTKQGVGAASARRIMGRGAVTRLVRDIPELKPFLRPAADVLEEAFSRHSKILLEGTQGTGLSLYHGKFPYVTSRDTTVAGCLAEAGIAPHRVSKVVMVCRTYPIRVESPKDGSSGPMSQEIPLAEIGRRSGLDPNRLRQAEVTSTTGRQRRFGEFDWELLHRATFLNGPTDIALTFTDYFSKENLKARRFEQLTLDTINFVEEVERVTGVPVSLIATGFNSRSIIDRRRW